MELIIITSKIHVGMREYWKCVSKCQIARYHLSQHEVAFVITCSKPWVSK